MEITKKEKTYIDKLLAKGHNLSSIQDLLQLKFRLTKSEAEIKITVYQNS